MLSVLHWHSNLWTSSEIRSHFERQETEPKKADAESPFEACDTRREAQPRHQGLNNGKECQWTVSLLQHGGVSHYAQGKTDHVVLTARQLKGGGKVTGAYSFWPSKRLKQITTHDLVGDRAWYNLTRDPCSMTYWPIEPGVSEYHAANGIVWSRALRVVAL